MMYISIMYAISRVRARRNRDSKSEANQFRQTCCEIKPGKFFLFFSFFLNLFIFYLD